jgi:hypothetical protein
MTAGGSRPGKRRHAPGCPIVALAQIGSYPGMAGPLETIKHHLNTIRQRSLEPRQAYDGFGPLPQ